MSQNSSKYKKPIFLNHLTYKVRRYASRKGVSVLQNKEETFSSEEVCIGNTLEDIKNIKYNLNLKNRLELKFTKTYGADVRFVSVTPITQCGWTNYRFLK